MNTSSYVRMGMSHFYFDPSSGYYWNGKEWLTREKYDEEVGKAWEVYNCTQAGAGIQQQQQQQYQQPVVPQPQYNIQHQQQQYYQQQQPVVLQQPQQGYYAAPQPPTGQDPYRNVVPQPQYNMQQQQQQWPIPQQPYHVAYQSAPPALLQQQHPASTNPYANIKQWIHRSLLSLTSSGCTDDEANALVAAKVEEVGENADWDNLPVCGSVVKPVEGNYGGGYNAGLAKRVREETVAPRAKKSRFDKAPPANVGVSGYYGPTPTAATKSNFEESYGSYGPSSAYSTSPPHNNNKHNSKRGKSPTPRSKSPPPSKSPTNNNYGAYGPNGGGENAGFRADENTLNSRANRFKGDKKNDKWGSDYFLGAEYMGGGTIGGTGKVLDESDYEKMTVVGLSEATEKEFFRLTSAPIPSDIRTPSALEKSFKLLKKKIKSQTVTWDYIKSQFKGIRQDLTVQRITNDFARKVYETCARCCLEYGDFGEFNMCLTHCEGEEFEQYRILYCLYLEIHKGVLSRELLRLASPSTMCIWAAWLEGNYKKFGDLCKAEEGMGGYILDFCLERVRFLGLTTIIKAYKPSVSAAFVITELGFDGDSKEEGLEWIKARGALVVKGKVDCKDSIIVDVDN